MAKEHQNLNQINKELDEARGSLERLWPGTQDPTYLKNNEEKTPAQLKSEALSRRCRDSALSLEEFLRKNIIFPDMTAEELVGFLREKAREYAQKSKKKN